MQICLSSRIKEEKPAGDVDLRNRLDPNGQRQGKYIPYAQSEMRVHALTDKVCDDLSMWRFHKADNEWLPHERTRGLDLLNPLLKSQGEEEGKRLQQYCHRILDDNEDEISKAIRRGKFELGDPRGELNPIYNDVDLKVFGQLCHAITDECTTAELDEGKASLMKRSEKSDEITKMVEEQARNFIAADAEQNSNQGETNHEATMETPTSTDIPPPISRPRDEI